VYGDSWRKHGELLSIWPNITRKVDRLEIAMTSEHTTPDETLIDTLADTAVYCTLYYAWLLEQAHSTHGTFTGAADVIVNSTPAGYIGATIPACIQRILEVHAEMTDDLYNDHAYDPSDVALKQAKVRVIVQCAVEALRLTARLDTAAYVWWANQWPDPK
jgi:hypothetical protein